MNLKNKKIITLNVKNPSSFKRRGVGGDQGILILENWVNKQEALDEADLLLVDIAKKFRKSKISLGLDKQGDRIFYILQKLRELDNLF
jgi:hypothetical protein